MIDEKKRILTLVQEGKLTAQEALILLEKLDNDLHEKEEVKTTELSPHIAHHDSNQGSKTEKESKSSSLKSKFAEFVDTAVKKMKDLDLDFNFGQSIEVHHIFQHSDVSLHDIELDVANGSIELLPWNENDVRVECKAKVFQAEDINIARQAFLQEVLFSIDNGRLKFFVQKKQMKVHIVMNIPLQEYEKVKIRMFNGPISGEKLITKDLKTKTANGAIKLTDITAASAEIETVNGQIILDVCKIDDMEAETINGTVKVNGNYERVDLRSFNGSITCTLNEHICSSAHLKTTTGSIDLFCPEKATVEGECKTSLGSNKCELPNTTILNEKNDKIYKLLRFRTNEGQSTPMQLFAETKTGSITIKPN